MQEKGGSEEGGGYSGNIFSSRLSLYLNTHTKKVLAPSYRNLEYPWYCEYGDQPVFIFNIFMKSISYYSQNEIKKGELLEVKSERVFPKRITAFLCMFIFYSRSFYLKRSVGDGGGHPITIFVGRRLTT